MGRFTFWILFAACLIAGGGLYAVKIRADEAEVGMLAASIETEAIAAEEAAERTMGGGTLDRLGNAQKEARDGLNDARSFFATRDAENLDRWFPALQCDWGARPKRQQFVTEYNLAVDGLTREVTSVLEENEVRSSGLMMIDYPWRQRGADAPPTDDLAKLQRTYWYQDRLHRAFARMGGRLVAPMSEESGPAALGLADALFEGRRFRVEVGCRSERLLDVLRALDGPFEIQREDGSSETVSPPFVVDDVAVSRLDLDSATANEWLDEPPVRVTFFLTALDFKHGAEGQ